jgi:DNA-3-methyladenine glycosylase
LPPGRIRPRRLAIIRPATRSLLINARIARIAVPSFRRLKRTELPKDSTALARYLLGKLVVRTLPEGRIVGRIVETEAYLVGDAACHGFRGETPRNRSLFGERGHAYVYIAYGISRMLNVVGEGRGIGSGVLIRALEPLSGIALMQHHRGTGVLRGLTRGPGRLAQALKIDLDLDGTDLCAAGPLFLAQDGTEPSAVGESIRIGITKDADRKLRFYVRFNPFVSGPKRLNP